MLVTLYNNVEQCSKVLLWCVMLHYIVTWMFTNYHECASSYDTVVTMFGSVWQCYNNVRSLWNYVQQWQTVCTTMLSCYKSAPLTYNNVTLMYNDMELCVTMLHQWTMLQQWMTMYERNVTMWNHVRWCCTLC